MEILLKGIVKQCKMLSKLASFHPKISCATNVLVLIARTDRENFNNTVLDFRLECGTLNQIYFTVCVSYVHLRMLQKFKVTICLTVITI